MKLYFIHDMYQVPKICRINNDFINFNRFSGPQLRIRHTFEKEILSVTLIFMTLLMRLEVAAIFKVVQVHKSLGRNS